MRRILATGFLGFILVGNAALAGAMPEVRLVLDEQSVLPGIPTGITVTVANHGEAPAQLPASLWLIATNARGEVFPLRNNLDFQGRPTEVPLEVRTIPPGVTREIRIDVPEVILGMPWLLDGRISSPGKYRLRAVFVDDMAQTGEFDASRAYVSNEETLTVATASAADAAVWDWMQKTAPDGWGERAWLNGRTLAEFVFNNHPQSSYALYVAIFMPKKTDVGPSHFIEEVVKRSPDKPFTDQLKLRLAADHSQLAAWLYASRSDLERVAEERDKARDMATELASKSRSSTVRQRAREIIDRTPTREQLIRDSHIY